MDNSQGTRSSIRSSVHLTPLYDTAEVERDKIALYRSIWFWSGVTAIFAGLLSLGAGIGVAVVQAHGYWNYMGIWCGVFYAIAGGYAIVCSMKSTRGMVIFLVFLNVFTGTLAFAHMILSALSIQEDRMNHQKSNRTSQLAANGAVLVAAFLKVVSAIAVSVASCAQMDVSVGVGRNESKAGLMTFFASLQLRSMEAAAEQRNRF